ncbi:MAG: ABC transporter ATP-binding protein [Acidobacteria bacterium]|nr:ABC transporter ATP-binding protein [Acidobacteriota bacterium]
MLLKTRPAATRLLGYLGKHTTALVTGVGCVLISDAIALMAPLVVRDAVNDLLREVTSLKLNRYGGLILAIAVGEGIFLYLQRRILVGMSREIEYEMRNDYFAHLLKLEPRFFHGHRTGDLMSRATNDLNAVRMVAGPAIMYLVHTIAVFMFAIPLMLKVSVPLSLLALSPTPLVFYATRRFGTLIHARFEKIQESLASLSARAQESFSGVRVVRAYVQERCEIETFQRINREYVRQNLSLARISGMFFPTLHVLIGLGFVVVLWFGGTLTARGVIDVGQFVQFNLYLSRMIWPMIALGWVVNLVQRGMASMDRIDGIMSRVPEIADLERGKDEPAPRVMQGQIVFRGLTYSYFPGKPVLKSIDLEIKAGSTVAIVGRTGSGKTTLVNMIARLIDPPAGQVLIDGHDVREIPLAGLRSAIGFVPQEPFLFSASLAANIALGSPEAGTTAIERAAERAGLLEDIRDFPAGFETLVGERGIKLSGGQKQRAAIARAVIRRPRILILDDALSSVDTRTEEIILGHLRQVMRESTSILISHRISTVQHADRIFVLDDGRIAEQGTHESLLSLGGIYAGLHEKQILEEELAASA